MRSFKEIQQELLAIRGHNAQREKELSDEMWAARQYELAQNAEADFKAGRTNSCRPTMVDKYAAWETRDDGKLHCSYCGSLFPADVVELLKTDGTHYSGSDWKYGYPHKFYIGEGKFYTRHIFDCPADKMLELVDLLEKYLGIKFWIEDDGKDKKLMYRSPAGGSYGFQLWGVVGKKTCQTCGCVEGARLGICPCACHERKDDAETTPPDSSAGGNVGPGADQEGD